MAVEVRADAGRWDARARDRALLHASLAGAFARVGSIAVTVLTVSIVVRSLGDVRYGVLATLTAFVGIFGFADLGVGNGVMSKVAVAHGRDDRHAMRVAVSSAWSTLWALGALFAACGWLSCLWVPWQNLLGAQNLPESQVIFAVAVFFGCVGLGLPMSLGQQVLVGLQRGRVVGAWTLAGSLSALLAAVFCHGLGLGLPAFVLAIVGAPVAVLAIQTMWLFIRTHTDLRPRWQLVSADSVRALASISSLYLSLGLAVAVAYQSDIVVVSAVLGAATAAVFAVALRMFGLVGALFGGVLQQLWPAMTEALERRDIPWVRSRFRRVLLINLGLGIGIGLVLVVFGQALAKVWVGPSLVPPLSLLISLALWTAYGSAMSQCSALLNAAHIVKPQIVMATLMAVSNIALSIWLTKRIGLSGPVIGSLVSHVLFAGIPTVVLVRRVLRGEGGLES